jgi:hypothetical protein
MSDKHDVCHTAGAIAGCRGDQRSPLQRCAGGLIYATIGGGVPRPLPGNLVNRGPHSHANSLRHRRGTPVAGHATGFRRQKCCPENDRGGAHRRRHDDTAQRAAHYGCRNHPQTVRRTRRALPWRDETTVEIDARNINNAVIPLKYSGSTRTPILFVSPLLHRLGKAELTTIGGCSIGPRPINYHIAGLRQLGVQVEEASRTAYRFQADRLHGNIITLEYPSVGATENLLMAAVGARGRTVIRNAAIEPEILNLAGMLQAMARGGLSGCQPDVDCRRHDPFSGRRIRSHG